MNATLRILAPCAIAALALGGPLDSAAQPKAGASEAQLQVTDMNAFLCKDIMRLSGEDRAVTMGVLHGYFLGKKGATTFVNSTLAKMSDDFTEYCLDNPAAKAMDAFARFAK